MIAFYKMFINANNEINICIADRKRIDGIPLDGVVSKTELMQSGSENKNKVLPYTFVIWLCEELICKKRIYEEVR